MFGQLASAQRKLDTYQNRVEIPLRPAIHSTVNLQHSTGTLSRPSRSEDLLLYAGYFLWRQMRPQATCERQPRRRSFRRKFCALGDRARIASGILLCGTRSCHVTTLHAHSTILPLHLVGGQDAKNQARIPGSARVSRPSRESGTPPSTRPKVSKLLTFLETCGQANVRGQETSAQREFLNRRLSRICPTVSGGRIH